jgi:hypothetical protein
MSDEDHPYPPIIPNAATIAALQETNLKSFKTIAELMADLHEDQADGGLD